MLKDQELPHDNSDFNHSDDLEHGPPLANPDAPALEASGSVGATDRERSPRGRSAANLTGANPLSPPVQCGYHLSCSPNLSLGPG